MRVEKQPSSVMADVVAKGSRASYRQADVCELRSNDLVQMRKCGLGKVQHAATEVVQLFVFRV